MLAEYDRLDWIAVAEPLALCSLDREDGPMAILQLAGVVTKVALAQVAVQVLLAGVVMRAVDGPLQLQEVALDTIGSGIAPDVLVDAVVHDLVPLEDAAGLGIEAR